MVREATMQTFAPQHPSHAISDVTWRRIQSLNPSAVSDILHAREVHNHVLGAPVQALGAGMRLAGIARTLSSKPLTERPEAGREYELLFGAIDGLSAGEILVTDEMNCCVWGELCSEAAMRRGGNGALIDGYTRDSADIIKTGFPIFCRGRHMSDLLYHRTITELNEPVVCGGVHISPGDLILGAEDGVLAVPAAIVEEVVTEAYEKSLKENTVRAALRQGMSAGEAYRQFGVM